MNRQESEQLISDLEDLKMDLWNLRGTITQEAREMGISQWKLKNPDGTPSLLPIVQSMVQIETTIAALRMNDRPIIINNPPSRGRAW
jgi:hypothetical protein